MRKLVNRGTLAQRTPGLGQSHNLQTDRWKPVRRTFESPTKDTLELCGIGRDKVVPGVTRVGSPH